jgi:predicted nucleic acid-binding protein
VPKRYVWICSAALASIKVTVEMQKKADKSAQAATTFMNDIEREIATAGEKGDAAKATRTKMRLGYKLSAFDAKIASIAASENVKACKGVLAFAAASLKQYK